MQIERLNLDKIDSPSLILFEDRLQGNIQQMIAEVNEETNRLMPHVKTNKCQKVIEAMVQQGITRFKAATIVETELAAKAGAKTVLLAHQPVGPKIEKLSKLILQYPQTQFSTLVDNSKTAQLLHQTNPRPSVYIDVNNGMNRSGIKPGQGLTNLIEFIQNETDLELIGLHVYDGHLHQSDLEIRKNEAQKGLEKVGDFFGDFEIIAGGTPTFSVHKNNKRLICSPGTSVFHDWGYGEMLKEQHFEAAVLLVTRVISKPTEGIVTIDLGHKAVAAENPIDRRFKILNLEHYELLSQSEEHGVLKVKNWDEIEVGDVFFAIPYHICPTVNLHHQFGVIRQNSLTEYWPTMAATR
ncbi:D-TA family PLP-dependent enzyme [Jiulongibacter sediminis]|jgi:D-serine deaminase-like pyridoxal phosphate-dependent protein|uniref:D-TA family PLP-dependent enzyme n=1 Tax=Jiulongibacter sediminis TaxID=1605367 RepID=UPI0026EA587E|nr:D-TA family PLP-dependent enzyme [Jiulongibacter sediminis]